MLHGGNGWNLIGWNLRFRMFRERSRRRGLAEEVFWEIMADEPNSPRLQPKEKSFPEHIQYRLALRRMVSELIRTQGANPRHHKDAVLLETHFCPPDRHAPRPGPTPTNKAAAPTAPSGWTSSR